MPFQVKQRGKVTYYYEGERPTLSALVTEEQSDGDLKIYFAGLTGGYSAKSVLGLDELVTMDPAREIPLVFKCWEKWLQDAGICQSIADVDFIEIHAFGCQPKSPNPMLDPEGFAAEQQRLYKSYSETYANWFKENCPDNGVPARFTVHVVDVPDKAASYEFYGTALYQKQQQDSPIAATEPSAVDAAATVRRALKEMSQDELRELFAILQESAYASTEAG